jgi:type IV secretory pathway protease TraF
MTVATKNNLAVTPLNKTPWFALPCIALCIGVVAYPLLKVQIVMTESIEATIVWPSDRVPVLGDFVTFKLKNKVIPTPDNTVQVTKILSCTPDQVLSKDEGIWTCDGQFIGHSREFAMNGDKLEQFSFNGKVPIGKAFLTGTHKNSFDSRYWGFVDINELTTVDKVL